MSITLKQKIIIILIIILIIQVLITLYLLYDWWKNKNNINNKKENFLVPIIAAIPDAFITISHSRFGNWKYDKNDNYKIKLKIGIETDKLYIKNNPLIYNNINNRVGLYFKYNQGNNIYIQHSKETFFL